MELVEKDIEAVNCTTYIKGGRGSHEHKKQKDL